MPRFTECILDAWTTGHRFLRRCTRPGPVRAGGRFRNVKGLLPRDSSGQALILVALCMPVLFGMLGLAIDAGILRYQKRLMQNAADAAALAGALEIASCGSTANCSALRAASQSAVTENGATGSSLLINCATRTGKTVEVTVNNPPCAVSADPNYGNSQYVEVVVSKPVPTMFMRVLGITTVPILARAEAAVSASPCVYFLSLSSTQDSLSMTNQSVSASCTFYLGLSYSFSGGSSTGSPYLVAGSKSKSTGSVSPTPTFNVPVEADPLSSVAAPSVGSCNYTTLKVTGAYALKPGVYCGGLTINTTSTVTMASGTYIILGALSINGPTLTGTGVTFYVTQGKGYSYGASSIDNVNATLSAPTSGTLQGILYFSDRTLPAAGADLSVADWNPSSRLDGILYLAGQELTVSNATLQGNQYFGVVADYAAMNNAGFTPSNDYSALSGGNPFQGSGGTASVVQ